MSLLLSIWVVALHTNKLIKAKLAFWTIDNAIYDFPVHIQTFEHLQIR
jgi:hypothetical protein